MLNIIFVNFLKSKIGKKKCINEYNPLRVSLKKVIFRIKVNKALKNPQKKSFNSTIYLHILGDYLSMWTKHWVVWLQLKLNLLLIHITTDI